MGKQRPTKKSATHPLATTLPGDAWEKNPGAVRRFLEQRVSYEQLCNEVAYIMSKCLSEQKLKVVGVTQRAKTLESFLEKMRRKTYSDPFAEMTDFAGTRVVCYYPDDLPKVGAIITENFEVVEHTSKRSEKAEDQFGYLADHYLIKLGPKTAGARYDDLKHLVCEIQVRTVLQDAWAVFSHHLLYKHEDEVPAELKRLINSLAGALESADFSFQSIREKRDAYLERVANTSRSHLANVATNLDSLAQYLAKVFPGKEKHSSSLAELLSKSRLSEGYPTLADIDSLLTRTKKAREEPVRELNWLTIPGELFAALILDGYPGALRIASETARPKVLGYRNKVDKPKYTIP